MKAAPLTPAARLWFHAVQLADAAHAAGRTGSRVASVLVLMARVEAEREASRVA